LPNFTKPWLIPAAIEVEPRAGEHYVFDVVAHQEEGEYVVFCPQVGTSDYGDTLEYALRMLRAGTKLYLQRSTFPDYSKPQLIDFAVEIGKVELKLA
jgi:predicted RNase H-like HicB family nuclease